MIGQGSPTRWARAAQRAAQMPRPSPAGRLLPFTLAALLTACVFASTTPSAAQELPSQRSVRLRVAWGGGEQAARWSGQITVPGGSFADVQLLGMDADAPGSIWLDRGVIHIDSIRPHRFDGIDVTVTAAADARLTVHLAAEHVAAPIAAEVPLADAAGQPFRQPLDDRGNVLLIYRPPDDLLRIETDREQLIFAPGEEFAFTARPVLDELTPSTTVDVTCTLSPARGTSALWTDPQRLPVPVDGELAAAVRVPLPQEEGVYTVRVHVAHAPGFRDRFLPGAAHKPLAERAFQVVVLHPTADAPTSEPTWQTVLEIDPANPRWWQRMPSWTQLQRLPGAQPRPLGSMIAGAVDHPLGRFIELPPTVADGEPHWQAYMLPIERVGVAHRLEVQYPADREQHFGLSVLEPNATGRVVPVTRDSGVYVEGLGRVEQQDRGTHRYVFWPRSQSPLLLVTNQHPTAAARFGRIRVQRAHGRLAGGAPTTSWREAERIVAAYVSRPLVPETFGATEGFDAPSGQSIEDWQTFYQAAERLAEYLPYAGYNAAVVSVLADGSSTFPTTQLRPTPMYHTGRMVAGTSDLPEADPLEITLRLFDRAGLALVPTLQLAAPLPALEPLRRATDPRASGLEWVGPDGRTWLETHGTNRGLAPYYNLLDERVQQAVLDVVRELVDRYGHHPSLAGMAVQLAGDGYAQLPGLDWGLDDATIARFERDTGIELADSVPDRFAARESALRGEHADAWRTWRAERVTRFYRQLAELVRAGDSQRRLLLTTEEMFSTPRLKSLVKPTVLGKSRVERVMLDVGIDRDALEQVPGLDVCVARAIAPSSPLVDRAVDLAVSEALATGRRRGAEGDSTAAMFFHRPKRLRLASFDAKSPLPSHTMLVSQAAADGAASRQRFVAVLADDDPAVILDGGELLPMGQESATRDLLRMLQRLPVTAEETIQRAQPVTLRTYVEPHRTTLLLVNDCPWSADVEVSVDVPHDVDVEPLVVDAASSTGTAVQSFAPGRQTWPLRLEPYGVHAVRVNTDAFSVAELKATISDAAQRELAAKVAELAERNLTAPSAYNVLTNAGFEAIGGGDVPGWQLTGDTGATAQLDATDPRGGATCLRLESSDQIATVESNKFATPATGQLMLTVHVRGAAADPNTELRMVFEADRAGGRYRRFATVGGSRPGAQPLGDQWQYVAFHVSDLPLDSQGRMQVKFELAGPGQVWIDDVQLHDLLFPLSFYEYSSTEKKELLIFVHAARSALESGRWSDAVRRLEGYWPRFLLAYTPAIEPTIAQEPPRVEPEAAPPADDQAEQPADAAPGIGERLRRYVPFWR